MSECQVEGCSRPRKARGWCATHYSRYLRHGTVQDPVRGFHRTPEEAFEAYTRREGDCLVWTAATTRGGYGAIAVGGKNMAAHRYAWERENGPIPDGMEIDHICWNPPCVEASHMRLATRHENARYHPGAFATNKSTGRRNVQYKPKTGKYVVAVEKDGVVYGSSHDDLEFAAAVAASLRARLFGEYAGRG